MSATKQMRLLRAVMVVIAVPYLVWSGVLAYAFGATPGWPYLGAFFLVFFSLIGRIMWLGHHESKKTPSDS